MTDKTKGAQAPTPGPLSGYDGYDGHYSDCAIHNAPALPVGPCDCGSPFLSPDDIKRAKELRYDPDSEDNERFASWYGDTLLDVHALALRQSSMLHRLAPTREAVQKLLEEAEDFTDRMTGQPWACEIIERLVEVITTSAPVASGGQHSSGDGFQPRVHQWLLDCFGWEIAGDRQERGDRLLEEVLELLQSGGYDPARVAALRDYVWRRPVGEPAQEVGGVMVTLAAYCVAHDLDMMGAGETELSRIVQPEIVQKIRAKQAAKPTGSALPIAVPAQDDDKLRIAASALLDACVKDFGDPAEFEGDDGSVARSKSGGCAVTFKHMRDLNLALQSTAAQEEGE